MSRLVYATPAMMDTLRDHRLERMFASPDGATEQWRLGRTGTRMGEVVVVFVAGRTIAITGDLCPGTTG